MPYVNCPKCSVRSFALAPWSSVAHCPICDTPLSVRRQGVDEDSANSVLPRWSRTGASEEDAAASGSIEAG